VNRLFDAVAGRAWFLSRLFLGLGIVICAYYWLLLTSETGAPVDVHAYWAADPNDLYPPASDPLSRDAYLYAPPFEILVGWGRHLDFEVFTAIWRALLLVTLIWLAGPAVGLVIFLFPVASEINAGNIQLLLAAAIVLSLRGGLWPATWALVLLTKVTPGVGLLWFALRREWRPLVVAIGATMTVAAVTFVVWPDRWLTWLRLLVDGGEPAPLEPFNLPFWPRVVAAVVIVAIGAWRGWRWPVVVGVTLALPAFYTISPSMLVGVLPFAREAASRWAMRRREMAVARG
jgi:Glycosyltransferase family 87